MAESGIAYDPSSSLSNAGLAPCRANALTAVPKALRIIDNCAFRDQYD